ncbi:MAG: type II toxin-antitoxin system HipA family toxin [Clostridia bacterium]|nr:type II toxin-antitoxin system HipA family toxin [Clostridia bacterium]MBQ6426877.1 type II toxin-antitoxin system HipA family toxin [Clostridia bacterium]MBR0445260.1 type II toxin-antitoxin system HipA family toxin [Clostridia bacterium]
MEYIVSIERNGVFVPVGTISGESSDSAQFWYADSFLEDTEAAPVSVSLPLQPEAFPAGRTKAFFDGLLPEGFTRRAVAEQLRLDERDYVRILHRLGRECIGALRIHERGEEPAARYEKLSSEQVRQLASEGAEECAAFMIESRLCLAGATGKAGLYLDPEAGGWHLPQGTAPSTHIVKQSHVRLKQIVPNELLCLLTAKNCGIDVPDSFIIDLGAGDDADILLASGRYDRFFPQQPRNISGLQVPLRLHQEDFAQALGIPASDKYESGEPYLGKMFALLRTHSAHPVEDQLKLWDRIIFNYLIGNTDGHLKNYSLLYSPDLKALRLAPAYDVVNTTGYPRMTHSMAFAIGKARQIEEVTRDAFRMAAKEAGLGPRMALDRLDDLSERFCPALDQAAVSLESRGVKGIEQIRESILKTGGIAMMEDMPEKHVTRHRSGPAR